MSTPSKLQAGSHLDHLIRQTRAHHVQLSVSADMKANMLLTVASVVITIAFPYVDDPRYAVGVAALMGFCLLTVGLAVYTVMPRTSVSDKRATPEEARSPGFNLLFFGDFTRLTQDQWSDAMQEVLEDRDLAYATQLREVYTLGRFLATRKYRPLRWAYCTFLAGFVVAGGVLLGQHLDDWF